MEIYCNIRQGDFIFMETSYGEDLNLSKNELLDIFMVRDMDIDPNLELAVTINKEQAQQIINHLKEQFEL